MSASVLIEAVKSERFGGGGGVAAAFVGAQFDWPAAGAAGGGIFPESKVADMAVSLDGPLPADQAGQVTGGGIRAGTAGDGGNSLAGGPAGRGRRQPPG